MESADSEVLIRRLHPEDWRLFRDIRLRALEEAPSAFGATLAEARELDEPAWRGRLSGRAQFMAIAGSRTLGTAAGIAGESGAELISMWVDPRVRGTGVGDRLVGAVLDWARVEGFDSIHLWVAAGNQAADRLYERNGFSRTGARQPMDPGRPSRCEIAMSRRLDRGLRA